MNFIIVFVICFHLPNLYHSAKQCDPSFCNYEGQCTEEGKVKTCKCVGNRYFQGPQCREQIDNCKGNPCQNGGKCQSLIGQFLCLDCNAGFAGQKCDIALPKALRNVVLYYNRIAKYSVIQKFIMLVEDLGSVPFSVEFVADNYVIDSYETNNPEKSDQWSYDKKLLNVLKKMGIHHYKDLPFEKGYYRLMSETFWDLTELTLTMNIYDAESASELLYSQIFEVLVLGEVSLKCVPKLKFTHGSDPMDPLLVDISHFNNFEAIITKRCNEKSTVLYKWSIFDSIGSKKLYDFEETQMPLLKIPAYRLWFNYHGAVTASYSLVLAMEEKWGKQRTITERRCFILVLPKPVKVIIKGGPHQESQVGQPLILDGSESRDFALPLNKGNELKYSWSCTSVEDPNNSICSELQHTDIILKIENHNFKAKASYQFSLSAQSYVNLYVKNTFVQTIMMVVEARLFIHIKCVRNCLRNKFVSENSIHLKLECRPRKECHRSAEIQWSVDGTTVGTSSRLIYTPKNTNSTIKITVEVRDKNVKGSCFIELSKNEPPAGGMCRIVPPQGKAFETDFLIECRGYEDKNTPLIYDFKAEEFPLDHTNDPEIHTRLPQCTKVIISICDSFQACTKFEVPIEIDPFTKPDNLEKLMEDFLKKGDRLLPLVLMKSLISFTKSEEELLELVTALESFKIVTLLELEQSHNIAKDLVTNILPLNNRKAKSLVKYFRKLRMGLEFISKDEEIQEMSQLSFENVLKGHTSILEEFAQHWEIIPQTSADHPQRITKNDPIKEDYPELPDFDIGVLERLANWVDSSRELYKFYEDLSSHASSLYFPMETHIIKKDLDKSIIEFKGIEGEGLYRFEKLELTIDEEFQQAFRPIILQMSSVNSNPFWWYPMEQNLTQDIISFSTFPTKSIMSLKFNLSSYLPKDDILVSLKSHLNMATFSLKLPPKAALIVILPRNNLNIYLAASVGKKPRGNVFQKSKPTSAVAINMANTLQMAHIAALAESGKHKFPFEFNISLQVYECLHWDWSDREPQWTGKGCTPNVLWKPNFIVQCVCQHLSIFSGKNYEVLPNEDPEDYYLLEFLPLSWKLLLSYISVLVLFGLLLTYNTHCWEHFDINLLIFGGDNSTDVEIQLHTGSHWNAGSSANIHLRFISAKGHHTVTVYQNPHKPQLKRNSVRIFYLSSTRIQVPCKLTIYHDQAGGFPSWFCSRIYIHNIRTKKSQLFQVNQWITEHPKELPGSRPTWLFWENVSLHYLNWFEFQPLMGPWIYNDLSRIQRCHIWVAQFSISLCIVACYYGPTTMGTYEDERDLYKYLKFTPTEFLILPLVCYVGSLIVKLIFIFLINTSN